jgi:hypothetical protein
MLIAFVREVYPPETVLGKPGPIGIVPEKDEQPSVEADPVNGVGFIK